jgi:branched-chain amino acid transport system ATP-binding protein
LADFYRRAADRCRAFSAARVAIGILAFAWFEKKRCKDMTDRLRLDAISKSFGGVRVSRDVTFSLEPGERVALIGPNGAGKTTLINLISGVYRPTSGQVIFNGRNVTGLSMAERARLGLVRSFQISRLFRHLTVFENAVLPILQREKRTGRMMSPVHEAEASQEAGEILERLGLSALAHHRVSEIAYGERRLVELAMALALRPTVLLLDEPAAGVGSAGAGRILDALAALPKDVTALLIDHDMDLVFRFAPRVLVLAEGSLIFDGPAQKAAADSAVRKAYLGSFAHERVHA